MRTKILATVAALSLSSLPSAAFAVEGGMGAYQLGSRASFAGIVPGPGFYGGLDYISMEGSVQGLTMGGLPIAADSNLSVSFAKLSLTKVFNAQFWGGTPALNLNIPFVFDASLSFVGVTPPLVGVPIEDSTSGIGDITLTPMVGWHNGKLHTSVALSIFAPVGSYHTASVNVPNRTIDAINTGKNIWSLQPVFAATYFDPATGWEFSGAASLLFSTRNKATDYQNAPALNLEGTVLKHTKSGWAIGASGYVYQQLSDDKGAGADATRAALGASSLKARVYGLGPAITYSGGEMFGKEATFKFTYYKEFGAKRRFESDIYWLNLSLTF
ncbi:MAG: transporter [Rhodobacteraceae bacterium]|nr:transporter [Paracoccaceae bacterium]